jgi:hypothetical protein
MPISIRFKGLEPMDIITYEISTERVESYADINRIDNRHLIKIHFNELTEFETLMEAYRNDDALSEISIINSNGEEVIFTDYMIRMSLSLTSVSGGDDASLAVNHWIMTLAQLTPTDKKLRLIVDTINKTSSTMTLDEYKYAKIDQSKVLLQKYLMEHPLISNCKSGIFAPYNATIEKQNLFIGQYALYVFNKQAGIEDVMTWNECGKPCTVWNDNTCIGFMNAMKAYTKPLVSAQQQYEVDIMAATTKTEVESMNIDYSEVETANGKDWWIGYTTEEIQRLNEYYGLTDEKPIDADDYLGKNNTEETEEN